jgi:hypothetical protein
MEWQTIDTVPTNIPVEVATLPMTDDYVPYITFGRHIRLAYPKATHWRELTEETVLALRAAAQRGIARAGAAG